MTQEQRNELRALVSDGMPCGWTEVVRYYFNPLLDDIDRLEAELARVTRERDAAIGNLMFMVHSEGSCDLCIGSYNAENDCGDCNPEFASRSKWKWRGVKEGKTDE